MTTSTVQPFALNGQSYRSTKLRSKAGAGFIAGIVGGLKVGPLTILAFIFLWPLGLFMLIGSMLAPLVGLGAQGGDCPNCLAPVLMYDKTQACPQCGHQLIKRRGRLVDVTQPL